MSSVLLFLVYITSVVLIVLVTMQTTKSDGFTGAIGGGSYAGKSKYLPGQEEMLQKYTTYAATIWAVCCLLWFLVSGRSH